MALSPKDRAAIRRHLGYPADRSLYAANGRPGDAMFGSWLGLQLNGKNQYIEEKMSFLTPDQEAMITGAAYGSFFVGNSSFLHDDSLTVTLSGGGLVEPIEIEFVTDVPEKVLDFLIRVARTFNQTSAFTSKRFTAFAPGDNQSMVQELVFVCSTAFTLEISMTGSMNASVTSFGDLSEPSIQTRTNPREFVYGLLPICNYLHQALGGSTQNLDTSQADVWKGQAREIEKRQKLLMLYRKDLADSLGVEFYQKKNRGSFDC